MDLYFGTYARFETTSKKDAAILLGADVLVGDEFKISFEFDEDNEHQAWLVSKFNQRIGYFDPQFSRKLSVLVAKGLTLKAMLSFIAFTDRPEPGFYWGEMAVVGYRPDEEEIFNTYLSELSLKLQDGIRPLVDLDKNGYNRLVEHNGKWVSGDRVPYPKKKTGTAVVKSKRSSSERMIEQGRKGNKGCYVISWVVIIGLLVLIAAGFRACGVF